MVGQSLNKSQMKNILINLSNLQSPWNCPHGRPTMVKTTPLRDLTEKIRVRQTIEL